MLRLSKKYWVIVPAYNETKYLTKVLSEITQYTPQVVVVDDGSRDDTLRVAHQLTPYVLHHRVNLGKGAALMTGCRWALADPATQGVIFCDADDQHDPSLLPAFATALEEGAELVCGVRDLSQMPPLRTLGNRLASHLVAGLFGEYLADIPSGYKALSRSGFETVAWRSTGYGVEMEIAARSAAAHLKRTEIKIPTIYHDFTRGMTMLDVLGLGTEVLEWRLSI
jgi:glycosyltransferase involved in cell wall biosynthesis